MVPSSAERPVGELMMGEIRGFYSRRNLGIYKAKVEKNRTKQIKAVFPSLGCIF